MKKLLALCFLASSAVAQDRDSETRVSKTIPVPAKDPWDLDLHFGAGFGTFTTKDNFSKSFGGLLTGASVYNEYLLSRFTSSAGFDFLIDGGSLQVIRKGVHGSLVWNFLGGKKQQIHRLRAGTFASSNDFALGWAWRLGYASFSATPSAVGALELTGSNLHLDTGLRMTWKYGSQSSLGVDAMVTLLSMAMSIEKSTQRATELTLSWRYYL
ncbi:MAG TPA: hypothetical protein VFO10_06340 [Oligoflexus sp.]|uniref:hypothetical protein n=1 Tax=Oligoflexus sp. TaxID=1971216 RepID=UPI002D7F20B1|nr:hypothetical protein [Oligoflexus sp.]HET9236849.1 hypothetical protein [Oligoflexus sp.]